jgi:hypothetical protein
VDYDDAVEIIVGWAGSTALVLCSFDMPGIGFEDRPYVGRLEGAMVPSEPGKAVVPARAHINGELQPESDDRRHFSVWSTDPFIEAQARPILRFFPARATFSESAWEESASSGPGLMVRHGSFRWVIFPWL